MLLAAGAVVGTTPVPGPIHELGHVLAAVATGGYGKIDGWASAWTRGGNPVFIDAAGYWFESLFYLSIVIIAGLWNLPSKPPSTAVLNLRSKPSIEVNRAILAEMDAIAYKRLRAPAIGWLAFGLSIGVWLQVARGTDDFLPYGSDLTVPYYIGTGLIAFVAWSILILREVSAAALIRRQRGRSGQNLRQRPTHRRVDIQRTQRHVQPARQAGGTVTYKHRA